jgi:predicted enzyme related to lactoylglutathione lyase
MTHPMKKLLAAAILTLAACTKTSAPSTTPVKTPTTALQIKLTTIYVDDQEKALRFYTDVLGFVAKNDESNSGYRWLTVTSSDDPDGTELQLALNADPAAKAYQQAMFEQSQPAAMFYTADVDAQYARMKAAGAEFTMPPTDVTFAKIAMLNDTCGNLIQITELY